LGKLIELGDRLVVHRTADQAWVHADNLKIQRQVASAREHASQQRVKKLKRIAIWADRDAIKKIYQQAQKLTRQTGILHEVDHIIPLLGRFVSGLHVENNLQIVTQTVNRKKSNHYEM
jgi:hypothetical protein